MTLGQQIRIAKDAKNLTWREIAEVVEVSQASVMNYSRDASYPQDEPLKKLCAYLGIESPASGQQRENAASNNITDEIASEMKRLNWSQLRLSRESGVSPSTIKKVLTGKLCSDTVMINLRGAFKDGEVTVEPKKPEKPKKIKKMSRGKMAKEIETAVNLVMDSGDPMWMIIIQPCPEGLDIRACARPKKVPVAKPPEPKIPDSPDEIGLEDLHG